MRSKACLSNHTSRSRETALPHLAPISSKLFFRRGQFALALTSRKQRLWRGSNRHPVPSVILVQAINWLYAKHSDSNSSNNRSVAPRTFKNEKVFHMADSLPSTPVVVQKAPYGVEVEAGKTYYWCACGLSAKQPFCDGSHKGTGLNPMPHISDKASKIWFCGCKASANKPLCDGAHKNI